MEYHNILVCGFVRSSLPRITVYVKQRSTDDEYAVKVLHQDGTKTIVLQTYSLSSALRELAESVAQFTDGFTRWKSIEK